MESERAFGVFGNVRVLEVGDLVTNKGPTAVAMVLHAVAVLLRESKEWSWFVNLGASDYPLLPQDGNFFRFLFFIFCEWFEIAILVLTIYSKIVR